MSAGYSSFSVRRSPQLRLLGVRGRVCERRGVDAKTCVVLGEGEGCLRKEKRGLGFGAEALAGRRGMGGGAMWRTVSRVVGSSPTTAASNAAMCRGCTTAPALKAPSSTSARMACSCPSSEVHSPSSADGQSNPGMQHYFEVDDWVFAGDDAESLDYLVFGTVPSKEDVEEATSELQHALQIGVFMGRSTASPLESESSEAMDTFMANMDKHEVSYHVGHPVSDDDWKEPEPAAFEVASSSRSMEAVGAGRYSAMLDAFHQFQHNPQVQKMVVSLATDKSVWEAVLANDQIQEFRQKLRESTGLIENGSSVTVDEVTKALNEDTNVLSHVFWNTKKAFTQFMTTLQELIRGIFDAAEEKLKTTTINDDDDAFFERTLKSTMMLSVLVMSLVVFKRSAAHIS